MPEFKKIYCAYHDKQFITNFCVESDCHMPLCPSCIGAHNEFHKENGSKSTYNSIDNVLNHTSNSISNLIKSFENEQKRIENITGVISEMPLVLHQKLMVAKTMALNQIEKAFQKLEKQMVLKLCSKQQVIVGSNLKFVQNQLKTISESIISLQRMMKSLTGERCLSTVIKFLEHQHNDFIVIRDNLNSAVNSFECIEPFVNIDQEILQHIDPLLRNFVNIEFNENQESMSKSLSENVFEFEEISSTFSPLISHTKQRVQECKLLQPIKENIEKLTTSRKEKEKFKCDNEIENLSKKIAEMRKNNKIMSATLEKRK